MSEYNSQTSYNPFLGDGRKREFFNEEVNPHGIIPNYDSGKTSEENWPDIIREGRAKINAERMI